MSTQSSAPFFGHIARHVPLRYDVVAVGEDPWGHDDAPAVVVPLQDAALIRFGEHLYAPGKGDRFSVLSFRAALLAACIPDDVEVAA